MIGHCGGGIGDRAKKAVHQDGHSLISEKTACATEELPPGIGEELLEASGAPEIGGPELAFGKGEEGPGGNQESGHHGDEAKPKSLGHQPIPGMVHDVVEKDDIQGGGDHAVEGQFGDHLLGIVEGVPGDGDHAQEARDAGEAPKPDAGGNSVRGNDQPVADGIYP